MWYSVGKLVPFWQKEFHVPTHSDLGFPSIHDYLFFFFINIFFFWNIISTAFILCVVVVQLLSCVQLFVTSWTAAGQVSLSFSSTQSLLKLISIEMVMPSNHLILCGPLLLLSLIFPRIRVFSNKSVLHIRWPRYWSFYFSISPSNEYSGLISFKTYWFDIFPVQGTLKSLFQNHSWKASILQCSAFFMVQLSNPYMTTGKTLALTIQTFVSKVISLFFNTPF